MILKKFIFHKDLILYFLIFLLTIFLIFSYILIFYYPINNLENNHLIQTKYDYLIDNEIYNQNKCFNYSKYYKEFLYSFGVKETDNLYETEYILILGSGGLIGSNLKELLEKKGYRTLYISSRYHRDLRINNSLNIFLNLKIKFIYFLTFEVGGSKFLQNINYQEIIYESNILLMNNIFNFIKKNNIKFVFSSSSLSADNSSYGITKLIGENFTLNNPLLGKVFRLWNVYGFEYPGPKSHVIPEIITKCILNNRIHLLTDGNEFRQFSYVNDINNGLISLMENFNESPNILDLSDGNWINLKYIINIIKNELPNCNITFSNNKSKFQNRHEPNLNTNWHKKFWNPKFNISNGIKDLIFKIKSFYLNNNNKPILTIIINSTNYNINYLKNQINLFLPLKFDIILENNQNLYNSIIFNSKSDYILILNNNFNLSINYLNFFLKNNIFENLFIYFNSNKLLNKFINFYDLNNCSLNLNFNLNFILTSKLIWNLIKIPNNNNINFFNWIKRFKFGFHLIELNNL